MTSHLIFLTVAAGSGSGWAWVVLAVGFLAGGLLIGMSIINGRKAKESLQWPSVPGVVLSSEMITDTVGEIATFTPVVTYSYVVNGRSLQSARIRFNTVRGKKILAKYPKGCPVQVFFDPLTPSTAVLEKGGSTKAMMFVGAAVIVGSCLLGFVMS